MDLNEHIRHKELINMRESDKSDWRKDLETLEDGGDHPYVDVMPTGNAAEQMVKNKKKDKKKEKEQEVTESIKDDPEHQRNFKDAADNVAQGMAERRKRLDLSTHKKRKVEEGYVPLDHEGNEKQTARHLDHARKATKEGGDVDKHMKRADAVKSPFNRLMQLSAEREKKMEQKRRELYSSKKQ